MSCSYCGNANCTGACLNVNNAGGLLIQQNPSLYGTFAGQQQAQGVYGNYPMVIGQTNWIPNLNGVIVDTSLQNFLDIIADKSDTDACVAFIEQQFKIRAAQNAELERMKQQHQENLEKTEKEFLAKCGKYRPSISSEIMERVKKLKAFF